jgi:hypothetical protein
MGSRLAIQLRVLLKAPTIPSMSISRPNMTFTCPKRSVTTRLPYWNMPSVPFPILPVVISSVSTAMCAALSK